MPSDNDSTMRWKVDITQLKSAMQDAKRAISLANAEFKNSTADLGKWASSIDGVQAKIKQLNQINESQKTILANLQKQYDLVAKEMGEDSAEAQRLKIAIENQQAAIKKTDGELKHYNSALDGLESEQKQAQTPMAQLNKTIDEQEQQVKELKKQYANAIVGKNTEEAKKLAKEIDGLSGELADNKKTMADAEKQADKLDKSIDELDDSAKEAANGGFTVMKGALADLVAQGIGAAIDGVRRLGGAVLDGAKKSLSGYADYEQLVGGVEKLYGDASETMMQYAMDGYRTAGMSANEYLQQATGFSASLINSLGGDVNAAAEQTDVAMQAMADNVNVFGSNMEDVQNAFQGFAKQNFSMLDNLRLGYSGSKEEMERLIADANELAKANGEAGDLSVDSFSDIVTAIKLVQDQMGISGTTAKEALGTMSGSIEFTKSAWDNLLTAFAGGGDIDTAWDGFIEGCGAVVDNWLPRIKQLWDNVTKFIHDKMEEIAPEFTAAFDDFVAFIKDDLIPAISEFVNWILDNKDAIIAALAGIAAGLIAFNVVTMIQGLITAFNAWRVATEGMTIAQRLLNLAMNANPIGIVITVIAALVAAFITLWNTSEDFRNFWLGLWDKIKEVAGKAIEKIGAFFSDAWKAITKVWNGAKKFFGKIWDGIKSVFKGVVSYYKNLFKAAWLAITAIWNAAKKYFTDVWNGIKNVFSVVVAVFKKWFNDAFTAVKNIWNGAKKFFNDVWNGIKNVFNVVATVFKKWFNDAFTAVKNVWNGAKKFFTDVWNGIKNVFSAVATTFQKWFNDAFTAVKNIWNGAKKFFTDTVSNIKSAFSGIGQWFKDVFQGALDKVKGVWDAVKKYFEGRVKAIKDAFSGIGQWFKDVFKGALDKVKDAWSGVKDWFSKRWDDIKNVFGGVGKWFGDTFSGAWQAIKDKFSGWANFWGGLWEKVKNKFSDIGSSIGSAISSTIKSGINGVLWRVESAINGGIDLINSAIGFVNGLGFGFSRVGHVYLPRLAKGGVVDSATAAIIGEAGKEAIVPLERNKEWIGKVAKDMLKMLQLDKRIVGNIGGMGQKVQIINFNQTNNSPQALDRLSIYRDTKSLMFSAKVGLANV